VNLRLKEKAALLKREIKALLIASRDPRLPLRVRIAAAVLLAYALSPVDLIPDFIPILGYLDDLILIPAGIRLLLRWIPPEILEESRRKAESVSPENRGRIAAAVLIILLQAAAVFLLVRLGWRLLRQ